MTTVLIVLLVIAVIVCIKLAIHISALKKQMRNIKDELPLTCQSDYNRQLTISLIDNDLSDMTTQINKNLDYQKKLKAHTEKAEQSLKQSVSNIAHDLRTPLTVIKGNLQLLENEEHISARGLSYIHTCSEKTEAMKQMADAFFELSILESERSPVKLDKVNATNALMQFIADNEALIRTNNLNPEIIFPEKSCFILADENMLFRMLENLLNNIIKYAVDSFTLKMEMTDKCTITFSNAVDPSQQFDTEHLFDRSYRGDKARPGNGAGLGLYIVRLLAEKQDAKVSAERKDDILYMRIEFKTE